MIRLTAQYTFLFFISFFLTTASFAQDKTVLTIMVVYTEKAQDWAEKHGGGIDNVIAQGIAYTNQTLSNSDVDVVIELVHSSLIDYQESGNAGQDLGLLKSHHDGHMDEVHEWRRQYRADFVKLIIQDYNSTGSAFTSKINPSLAFSLTPVRSTSGSTFAHELGHNFGFSHSRNQNRNASDSRGGLFEYSTGWRWTGNDGRDYISIMSYWNDIDGKIANARIPYYSNPDVKYQGVPTGSYTGKFAPADNARSLREVKNELASFQLNNIPELVFPSNKANNLSLNTKFEWFFLETEIAESYTFQISKNPKFEDDNFVFTTETTQYLNLNGHQYLDYDQEYYWRIRANRIWSYTEDIWDTQSKWSETFRFRTEKPNKNEIRVSYPNPFNTQITFKVVLATQEILRIELFDMMGRSIQTVINETHSPGVHEFKFMADHFSSGIYFVRFNVGNLEEIQKITLVK